MAKSVYTEYDGAVKDARKNPVYDLLTRYSEMSEDEIINHMRSWWFNLDEKKLFAQARDSGLIMSLPKSHPLDTTFWKLAKK